MKQINTNLLHNPATEPFPTVNEDVCVNRRALPPLINIYSRSFGRDLGAGADHTPVRGRGMTCVFSSERTKSTLSSVLHE